MEGRFENVWGKAVGVNERGRHRTTASAIDAALKDLLTEKNEFFDSLVDNWKSIYPDLPAWPGRYEDGKIYIYVRNAPTSYVVRPKLRAIARRLSALPGSPKKLDLRLEIHAQ